MVKLFLSFIPCFLWVDYVKKKREKIVYKFKVPIK